MNKRDENDEKLKREWLKKNKPTICPPAYLNGINYLSAIAASRNFYERENNYNPVTVFKKGREKALI